MKRVLVYSHDTYGLGNVRRMLGICDHLLETTADISILLVTGSPVIQGFRLRHGLDYIKLPCLSRTVSEGYAVKSLRTGIDETMRLRSELLMAACANFRPDVFLVDKKPYGVKNELEPVLASLKAQGHTRTALILRDILDAPERTIATWRNNGYYQAATHLYDSVLVLGSSQVFDLPAQYGFPAELTQKTKFCGYTRRPPGARPPADIRSELGISSFDRLVVVTPGGGEDGFRLLSNYVAAVRSMGTDRPRSLIVSGPELGSSERDQLLRDCSGEQSIRLLEFTNDLMSYLAAANAIVCMGGYNTVCEVLSAERPAIIVPRVRPVEEQRIRAERMAKLGLCDWIHPDGLAPSPLAAALAKALRSPRTNVRDLIDFNGLDRVSESVQGLMARPPAARRRAREQGLTASFAATRR